MSEVIGGSCLCGLVSFQFEPPVLAFQHCHCSRCRKSTGSAHGANLFVRPEQFNWVQGEEHVRTYKLPQAKYFSHGFCERCGSSLPWASARSVVIPAGALDDDPGLRPQRAIFWDSRATWTADYEALEHFAELPRR